jgi:FtsP/CotA-like multicopper oxidase with cupredoxin domain
LHVSPQAPGDDSIDMVAAPGQALHYTVKIPANHPTGLYWYHTHAHGEAERQTLSGMSGALVIDGIAAYAPQVSQMVERILIARDAPLPGTALPNANVAQVYAMDWAMQHGISMHASRSTASTGSMRGTESMSGMSSTGTRSELHGASTRQTRNPYALIDPKYRRFVRPLSTSTHCVAGTNEAAVKLLTFHGAGRPAIRIAPGEQQFWRVVNAHKRRDSGRLASIWRSK